MVGLIKKAAAVVTANACGLFGGVSRSGGGCRAHHHLSLPLSRSLLRIHEWYAAANVAKT